MGERGEEQQLQEEEEGGTLGIPCFLPARPLPSLSDVQYVGDVS